jgi:hypothetical protein
MFSVRKLRSRYWGLILLGVAPFVACTSDEGGKTYNAWYRPVPLGWCPRYIIGDRHAWIVGKIAPNGERADIRRTIFALRGRFLTDAAGLERVRSSCAKRPYPVFELLEVVSERPMTDADGEPQVGRGPGSPDAGQASTAPADGGWRDPGKEPGVKSIIVPHEAKPKRKRYRRRKARRKRREQRRHNRTQTP